MFTPSRTLRLVLSATLPRTSRVLVGSPKLHQSLRALKCGDDRRPSRLCHRHLDADGRQHLAYALRIWMFTAEVNETRTCD